MRIAILETIVMPAGHEVEFDRVLVEELKKQGHDPRFFVPENFPFKLDYHVPVDYLKGGEAVTYAGAGRVKKWWLALQRESRRLAWFNDAAAKAQSGLCDAIIVPTNSWRVMRSIKKSDLRHAKVPVLFMFHGIMPGDRHHFVNGVRSLKGYHHIHLGALGLQKDFPELQDCPNFHTILPPVYIPFDMEVQPEFNFHEPLRLGFFGQYRKEKNLDFFLQAFTRAKFTQSVELTVQGATVTPEDGADFDRLAQKYADRKDIIFVHKNLLGIEWQRALMNSDVILMPYGAERYRYQPSAMLFTGIGYFKPVLQSPEMSPEVLEEFKIGEAVQLGSVETFSRQLELFVNTFKEKAEQYRTGLLGANAKYSQANLLHKIVGILQGTDQNVMVEVVGTAAKTMPATVTAPEQTTARAAVAPKRIAILESILTPAGHEVEFDRILIDELKRQDYAPCFFVPEHFPFKLNYQVPVEYLEGGEAISYEGAGKIKKLWLSMQRERRRIAWFNSACAKAEQGHCDAIIIPTSTYRYLRNLLESKLKEAPVPVYFIVHGVNIKEKSNFEMQAHRCLPYKNIHIKVISLRCDFTGRRLPNVEFIEPPVYSPLSEKARMQEQLLPPIKLGFFGQFRKEKKLDFFLQAFTQAKFMVPVQLIVQGATTTPEDSRLFELLATKYGQQQNITFLHENLLGAAWEKALLNVDAVMMPYAAERYRYHWSAMLFTAIGFYKPVLVSPELNPEVLAKYKIGMSITTTTVPDFSRQLESFVNDLVTNYETYRQNLLAANREYSQAHLLENILKEFKGAKR